MNDDLFERQVRDAARRIADGPAPQPLHAWVAAIPDEHPHPARSRWFGDGLRLVGATVGVLVVVVAAALVLATLPRNNAVVPGASPSPSPTSAVTCRLAPADCRPALGAAEAVAALQVPPAGMPPQAVLLVDPAACDSIPDPPADFDLCSWPSIPSPAGATSVRSVATAVVTFAHGYGRAFVDVWQPTFPSGPGAMSAVTVASSLIPQASPTAGSSVAIASPIALPDGLTDKAWVEMPGEAVAPYAAGMPAGSGHLLLPAGERPLGVSGDLVLSLVSPGSAAGKSELVVHNVATGAVQARGFVSGRVLPAVVALAPGTAYVAVQTGSNTDSVDRLDLSTGVAGPFLANQPAGALVASPSGRTLVVWNNPGSSAGAVTMVRPLAGTPYTQFSVKGVAVATSDTLLVTSDGSNLYGYSFATGRLAWTIQDILFQAGYVTSDGSRLVMQTGLGNAVGQGRGLPPSALENRISVVDLASGAMHTLVTVPQGKPGYFLWTQVSNDRAAVLIQPAYFPQEAFQAGHGGISPAVLELASGRLTPHALTVAEHQGGTRWRSRRRPWSALSAAGLHHCRVSPASALRPGPERQDVVVSVVVISQRGC